MLEKKPLKFKLTKLPKLIITGTTSKMQISILIIADNQLVSLIHNNTQGFFLTRFHFYLISINTSHFLIKCITIDVFILLPWNITGCTINVNV